jgi:hypothetical protein
VIASRRFVFTRSPERPGISAGATTRQSSPGTWICRRSWYPVSPAASKQTYNLLCLRASFLIRRSTVAGRFSISPRNRISPSRPASAIATACSAWQHRMRQIPRYDLPRMVAANDVATLPPPPQHHRDSDERRGSRDSAVLASAARGLPPDRGTPRSQPPMGPCALKTLGAASLNVDLVTTSRSKCVYFLSAGRFPVPLVGRNGPKPRRSGECQVRDDLKAAAPATALHIVFSGSVGPKQAVEKETARNAGTAAWAEHRSAVARQSMLRCDAPSQSLSRLRSGQGLDSWAILSNVCQGSVTCRYAVYLLSFLPLSATRFGVLPMGTTKSVVTTRCTWRVCCRFS